MVNEKNIKLFDTFFCSKRFIYYALEHNVPLQVKLQLTQKCNLRCLHCFLKKRFVQKHDYDFTFLEIKDIINQLAEMGTLSILLTGGEIFLRKDIFKILELIKEKGFELCLITNATLIDKNAAVKLKGINPDEIHISIYGMSTETYRIFTKVPRAYLDAINGVEHLISQGFKPRLIFHVLKETCKDASKFVEFAEKHKLEFKLNWAMTPCLDGSLGPLTHCLDTKEEIEHALGGWYKPNWCYKKTIGPNKFLCEAARVVMNISSYGYVSPCPISHLFVGNLREKSLKEIWEKSPILLKIRKLRYEKLSECHSCALAQSCRPCPAILYKGKCPDYIKEQASIRGYLLENIKKSNTVKSCLSC